MGLDQYAYAEDGDKQEEIAYWRKHNRLQGWMEELWNEKGRPNAPKETSPMGDFNCIPVQISLSDLEQLEAHVVNKQLPETAGFFFGDDSFSWDEEDSPLEDGGYYYKKTDLEFIEKARQSIEQGKKVYYNSWW